MEKTSPHQARLPATIEPSVSGTAVTILHRIPLSALSGEIPRCSSPQSIDLDAIEIWRPFPRDYTCVSYPPSDPPGYILRRRRAFDLYASGPCTNASTFDPSLATNHGIGASRQGSLKPIPTTCWLTHSSIQRGRCTPPARYHRPLRSGRS